VSRRRARATTSPRRALPHMRCWSATSSRSLQLARTGGERRR